MRFLKHTFVIMIALLVAAGSVPVMMYADESGAGTADVQGQTAENVTAADDDSSDAGQADSQTDAADPGQPDGADPDQPDGSVTDQPDDPEEPVSDQPDEPDPDDPDQPPEEEMEDPATYEPNPDPPSNAKLVTITGIRQVGGRGVHIASFSDGYGDGICCYHNRHYASVGQKGWMRRLEPGSSHYSDIRKVMYWGVYKKNGDLTLANAFSMHIMLSYWINGNKSLSTNIKEGTKRFKTAKAYCKTLTDKGDPPASFQIYEWVGTGAACKKQILITYNNGCYVYLEKSAEATDTAYMKEAPSNYGLKGAVYQLYSNAACTEAAKDVNGNTVKLTTDAAGKTGKAAVAPGQYWAKEISASPGFMTDSTVRTVTVSASNTQDSPAKIVSKEPPARGPLFELRKEDGSGNKGWKRMLGAEYTLRYYNAAPGTTDVSGLTPKRSWTFRTIQKTDANGKQYAGISFAEDEKVSGDEFYTENGKRVLPIGVFTIEETKAPAGMSRNKEIYYGKVWQPSNGAAAKTAANITNEDSMSIIAGSSSDVENTESPQGIRIAINKKDASGKAGNLSLAGAEYEVYYDDDELPAPELVGKIVTDENGFGELTKREAGRGELIGEKLAPGNYIIEEVKAAPGFVVDRYVFSDGDFTEAGKRDEDVLCEYEKDGTAVRKMISGSFRDGQHVFRARINSANTETFTFTVTSMDEPTRSFFKKTDAVTTKEIPGAVLQVIRMDGDNEGDVIEEWVSTEQEHVIYALPAGKYILREITAPYGYDVAEDAEFEIRDGEAVNRVEMKNKPVEITTTAAGEESGDHHGSASTEETITDNVQVSGLYAGRTYKVTGHLVDKETGETLRDISGEEVYSEKEFTATGDTAEIDIDFTVDTSAYGDDLAAVGFERLYRTSSVRGEGTQAGSDGLPLELARHEDIENESQTVHYGGIAGTLALDKSGHSKNIKAGRKTLIKDYVEFHNLSPEETYTLSTEIYDKTEHSLTGIRTETEFIPVSADGTTIVDIRFDARKSKGHDLVVFETLSLNGRVISVHEDPDDENQTVYIEEGRGPGPETGDRVSLLIYAAMTGICTAALVILAKKRLRRRF